MELRSYIEELTEIVRKYPRRGGQDPKGMNLLKQGEEWKEGSADPEKVAELLLGTQFDGEKATASCFKAAVLVTSYYGWSLTWKEDFSLGAYLISCLIRAKLYSAWQDYDLSARPEYRLSVRDQKILEFPEVDTRTSHKPFPIWFSAKDEQGHILVKPSHPQLKETVWEPDATHLRNAYGIDEFWNPSTQKWNPRKPAHEEFTRIQPMQWVSAVSALESNAYRVNERVLEVANTIDKDPKRRLPEGLPNYQEDKTKLDQRYKDEKIDELEILDKEKLISEKEEKIRAAYWVDHFNLVNQQRSIEGKRRSFDRTIKKANELKGKPFYHRAFCDYRGRIYLNDSIVNYQGGDLQRGLIEFDVAKEIRDVDWKFLWMQAANTWGLKGKWKERVDEAKRMQDDIIRFASDPVDSYEEWSEAGNKWQFLRACFEIKDALNNPDHQSHLICELDQSTSGLQHMALVMDDVEMLKKVNIGSDYADIYQTIGDDLELKGEISSQHRRKIAKTTILPWSYGGGIKRIVKHYDELELPYLQDLSPTERFHLARQVVEKIEQHLLKAEKYKKRMENSAKQWIKDGKDHFHWKTSSGFEVHHYKQMQKEARETIFLRKKKPGEKRDKHARLVAYEPQIEPDTDRLIRGLAPNFIHSIDADLIHRLLSHFSYSGPIVTVHDAIGAHACTCHEVTEMFYLYLNQIYTSFNPVERLHESMVGVEIVIPPVGISKEASDILIQSQHALT